MSGFSLYIIRHGKTELNQKNVLQGRSDYPLNENGIQQAMETAAGFRERGIRFSRVYSSPLIRAVQTARCFAEAEDIVIDDRLIEMDYGPYDGLGFEEFPPEILTFFSDFVHNPAPEGMEQLSEVTGRLGEFLEELKEEESRHEPGRNILISTHAVAMKGALEYLTPDSGGSYWSKYIGNCAVYRSECIDGRYTVPEECFS